MRKAFQLGMLLVALACLLLVLKGANVVAQTTELRHPTWHPIQPMIAVSEGHFVKFYSADFTTLIDEFALTSQNAETFFVGNMVWSPDGSMIAIAILRDGGFHMSSKFGIGTHSKK